MKIFAALLIAFAVLAVPAQTAKPSTPTPIVSSSHLDPSSVTHLTPAEQATLDRMRMVAQNPEDDITIKQYIAKIEQAHPGYHWEDHGVRSEKSGLAPDKTP